MCNQWKKLYQLKHQYLIQRMKYLTLLSSGLFQYHGFSIFYSGFQRHKTLQKFKSLSEMSASGWVTLSQSHTICHFISVIFRYCYLLSVAGGLIVRHKAFSQNKSYLPSFCKLFCSVMEEFSDNELINWNSFAKIHQKPRLLLATFARIIPSVYCFSLHLQMKQMMKSI